MDGRVRITAEGNSFVGYWDGWMAKSAESNGNGRGFLLLDFLEGMEMRREP